MLVIPSINRRRSELVHIDANVRTPLAKRPLDVARLLPEELEVLAVSVEVTRQLALEVLHAVDVVAGEDLDVHALEYGGGPGLVGVHFAQEGHDGLVACGLVAMDGGLDVDFELVGRGVAGIGWFRGGFRKEEVGDWAAFFGAEGCVLVG